MKDIKNIIIGVLLFFCLLFGYIWFLGGGKSYRDKIKSLEKTRLELIQERTNLDYAVDSLKKENQKLIQKDKILSDKVNKQDKEIATAKANAAKSMAELNGIKSGLKDTQEKIKEIQENPIKRSGDDLLNSLKQKTQK